MTRTGLIIMPCAPDEVKPIRLAEYAFDDDRAVVIGAFDRIAKGVPCGLARGYADFFPANLGLESVWEMRSLLVVESRRRQGIATDILLAAEPVLRAVRPWDIVMCRVPTEKAGFLGKRGWLKRYEITLPRSSGPGVLMVKRLAAAAAA